MGETINETIDNVKNNPSKKEKQKATIQKQIVQAVRDGKTDKVHKLKKALMGMK